MFQTSIVLSVCMQSLGFLNLPLLEGEHKGAPLHLADRHLTHQVKAAMSQPALPRLPLDSASCDDELPVFSCFLVNNFT